LHVELYVEPRLTQPPLLPAGYSRRVVDLLVYIAKKDAESAKL